jgi:predicted phosphodiesterase
VKRQLSGNRINLMVTGHSHILKVMWDHELDLLHINPGAAGYHGWQKERTLVRLVLDNGNMRDLEVIELGKKVMNEK